MLADEMYRISSASLPQPSPRSQFRSMVVITNFPGFPGLLRLLNFPAEAYHNLAEKTDSSAETTEVAFELGSGTLRLVDRYAMKTDAVVGPELSEQRKVG